MHTFSKRVLLQSVLFRVDAGILYDLGKSNSEQRMSHAVLVRKQNICVWHNCIEFIEYMECTRGNVHANESHCPCRMLVSNVIESASYDAAEKKERERMSVKDRERG